MAPGLGPLPAAAGPEPAPGAVDPVARLEPLLAALPRSTVTKIRLGLVFDWLPFPWRFSRFEPEARQEFEPGRNRGSGDEPRSGPLPQGALRARLRSDPWVQAAVGYEASCAVDGGAAGPAPAPRASTPSLEPAGSEEE